ncbi:MAG: hypothetical protein MUP47_06595 [Phycisphaerae bacterium]|nr:hypothetical protein [Phycisphaerae bacterium]
MPPETYFLTVRFPLEHTGFESAVVYAGLPDPKPTHESQAHPFYQVDHPILTERLVDLFTTKYDGDGDYPPIFEVVAGTCLDVSQRLLYREAAESVKQVSGFYAYHEDDGEVLIETDCPTDRGTQLLVDYHRKARQWEPLIRDELNLGQAAGGRGDTATARQVEAFGSSPGGQPIAGQRQAQASRESVPEKSSSAGAHSDVSANEAGPDTPGKVRTDGAHSVLRQIAEQLRGIPAMKLQSISVAEKMAGRLLVEALKHGAFARIKHAPLRTWIDEPIEKGRYGSAFCSAAGWFKEYEPHWPAVAAWQDVGSPSFVKNGCPLLADVIEAEADVPEAERVLTPPVPGRLEAVAKAEEIQRRQEDERRREQTRGRWAVMYGQAPAAGVDDKEDVREALSKSKPRHRPPVYDPLKDAEIVQAWQDSQAMPNKPTQAEFEQSKGLAKGELTKIIDRDRKRRKRDGQSG